MRFFMGMSEDNDLEARDRASDGGGGHDVASAERSSRGGPRRVIGEGDVPSERGMSFRLPANYVRVVPHSDLTPDLMSAMSGEGGGGEHAYLGSEGGNHMFVRTDHLSRASGAVLHAGHRSVARDVASSFRDKADILWDAMGPEDPERQDRESGTERLRNRIRVLTDPSQTHLVGDDGSVRSALDNVSETMRDVEHEETMFGAPLVHSAHEEAPYHHFGPLLSEIGGVASDAAADFVMARGDSDAGVQRRASTSVADLNSAADMLSERSSALSESADDADDAGSPYGPSMRRSAEFTGNVGDVLRGAVGRVNGSAYARTVNPVGWGANVRRSVSPENNPDVPMSATEQRLLSSKGTDSFNHLPWEIARKFLHSAASKGVEHPDTVAIQGLAERALKSGPWHIDDERVLNGVVRGETVDPKDFDLMHQDQRLTGNALYLAHMEHPYYGHIGMVTEVSMPDLLGGSHLDTDPHALNDNVLHKVTDVPPGTPQQRMLFDEYPKEGLGHILMAGSSRIAPHDLTENVSAAVLAASGAKMSDFEADSNLSKGSRKAAISAALEHNLQLPGNFPTSDAHANTISPKEGNQWFVDHSTSGGWTKIGTVGKVLEQQARGARVTRKAIAEAAENERKHDERDAARRAAEEKAAEGMHQGTLF